MGLACGPVLCMLEGRKALSELDVCSCCLERVSVWSPCGLDLLASALRPSLILDMLSSAEDDDPLGFCLTWNGGALGSGVKLADGAKEAGWMKPDFLDVEASSLLARSSSSLSLLSLSSLARLGVILR